MSVHPPAEGRLRNVLAALLLLVPAVSRAQATRPDSLAWRRRVLGVYDPATGEPVESARVLDLKSGNSAFTTATGTVTLAFLPPGVSSLRVQKLGYSTKLVSVTVTPDDTMPITVELEKTATPLPAVTARDSLRYFAPGLQGFMARSKLHEGGRFILEEELRKHDNQKLSSIVRGFPGVTIQCPRTGVRRYECWAVSNHLLASRGQSTCPVALYIDGTLSFDNDLEKQQVSNFAGVEFYSASASVPPQYNKTNNICGVLLLWTREH